LTAKHSNSHSAAKDTVINAPTTEKYSIPNTNGASEITEQTQNKDRNTPAKPPVKQ
jgi:hypothetical protein